MFSRTGKHKMRPFHRKIRLKRNKNNIYPFIQKRTVFNFQISGS